MDEMVKMVSQRTGLSEEMSRQAVNVVVEYLSERLPDPYGSQIKGLLAAQKAKDTVASKLKGFGGLFG